MSVRLTLAAEAGAFVPDGTVVLIGAPADLDLSLFGDADITVVQDRMPEAGVWQTRDVTVVRALPTAQYDLAIVWVPRAKAEAHDRIAQACAVADRVVIDGQKTDGIESLLKDMRRQVEVSGPISKSHGKLFWVTDAKFPDWHAKPAQIDGRWHVVPGVFSADGVDPGSALLASAFPDTLRGRVADLGAGWGYLSAVTLERCPKITQLDLVESHGAALDCAATNVADPRAQFHWADATTWGDAGTYDAVIMNPPFHSGRSTALDLGHAFVASAARLLRKKGVLWMVANRHLAYEQELRTHFRTGDTFTGDTKFKIFEARK